MRTESEFQALLVLLGDEQDKVAAVARETLLQEREAALPYLKSAAHSPDARLRGRARLLLEDIRLALVADEWRAFAALPDDDLDLEQGCLLLSRLMRDVDVDAVRAFLDAMADMVRSHMAGGDAVQAMGEVLFDNLGFRGGDHNQPENHYLVTVLERRSGIPISLAAVYVLVARRLGVPASGVATPAHYLVRVERGDGPVFVDCYNRGRIYRREIMASWLAGRGLPPNEQYLAPCSHRFTLYRMLNNLDRVYSEARDVHRSALIRRLKEHLGGDI
jgi:regulator of sirC expression with transglutaminase-like and TPR domain